MLSFVQLTSDGQTKVGPLLTDGSRIYFSEVLPSGWILSQVSVRSGQTISIPTSLSDPRPVDISPDRTELLVLSVKGAMAKELRGMELWVVPVAGGSARPVGNVLARDAAWSADGETILYADGHEIRLVNKDGSNRTNVPLSSRLSRVLSVVPRQAAGALYHDGPPHGSIGLIVGGGCEWKRPASAAS
jgi:hypothetical protein